MTEYAIQPSTKPTNKLRVGTTTAASIGAVLAGVMAAYGGPAIEELLPPSVGPNTETLVVMLVAGLMTWVASKYGGQTAAYEVKDRPNIPSDSEGRPIQPVDPRRAP